jgi:phage terminase large subunit GpA-like protein
MATTLQPDVPPLWLYRDVFRPAPRLSLSEWADRYGYLSDGQKWDTSVVPYLREPMDATTDRSVREVVVEKAARLGYTEGVVGQRVGFDIHHDPERILVVFPREQQDAKHWSQHTLSKMIQAAPVLRELVPEARSRESGNTILDKVFPGGSITIRGAHSPTGLRRHTARDVILDEIDGMSASSGAGQKQAGDPIMLATRACRTIADSKVIMGSTPRSLGSSRIRRALATSDWREYHVPCPHCREHQVLEWGGPGTEHGVKWAKEVACKGCGVELQPDEEECADCGSREKAVTHLPETAHYVCRHCTEAIEETEKPWMLEEGRWVPRYPGRSVRGYKISGLLSPFPGASWAKMAAEFLRSKDEPNLLQVWVNEWLGDPFEDRGVKVDVRGLEALAVQYVGPGGEIVEVPDGVGVLAAGVDVQTAGGGWLELLVRGYGVRWESWDILHERIHGHPRLKETWARLDHFLTRAYRHEKGGELRILSTFIDSKDGNTVEHVYGFVGPRRGRGVWPCRGDTGRADATFPVRPNRVQGTSLYVWPVATFAAKASLFWRLHATIAGDPERQHGPGRIHLRARTPPLCNGFDAEYFAQFGSEEKKRVKIKGTARYEERFVQTRERNETVDLQIYADSAFRSLHITDEQMPAWVEAAREGRTPGKKKLKTGPRKPSGGFVRGYR